MQQSIEIEGFSHLNPIPAASRVGPLVETSIIGPFDPGSRNVPENLESQLDNIFHHVEAILTAAGGTWTDIVKMNFYVGDLALRAAINGPWLERFPQAEHRPARHTQVMEMSGPAQVTCVFTAYIAD